MDELLSKNIEKLESYKAFGSSSSSGLWSVGVSYGDDFQRLDNSNLTASNDDNVVKCKINSIDSFREFTTISELDGRSIAIDNICREHGKFKCSRDGGMTLDGDIFKYEIIDAHHHHGDSGFGYDGDKYRSQKSEGGLTKSDIYFIDPQKAADVIIEELQECNDSKLGYCNECHRGSNPTSIDDNGNKCVGDNNRNDKTNNLGKTVDKKKDYDDDGDGEAVNKDKKWHAKWKSLGDGFIFHVNEIILREDFKRQRNIGIPTKMEPKKEDGEEPGRDERENKVSSFSVKWRNFTTHTTLHGIKYAFDDGPFRLRRILWLLCITSCMILFAYQAMNRVLMYLTYPSNVNLQIIYAESVQFPAVTVCNYNKHRLTKVVEMGLYGFISQVHKVDNQKTSTFSQGDSEQSINELNEYLRETNFHDVDLVSFILDSSHQRNDFILSCTWHSKPCDIKSNFTMKLTDFGVCYTFNSDPNNRLEVNKAGARSGLSVILNAEQYEYMTGPDHEAGIKILLHDPKELPQVKDLGFAVSPGAHVLVGVKHHYIENLQAPYGSCQPQAVTRSECLATCTSNDVFERCGCRDPYMRPPSKYQDCICSFTTSFFCIRNSLESSTRRANKECICPDPCKMTTYDPLLSYAQISQVSVNQFDLKNLTVSGEQIKNGYENARATFERVDQMALNENKMMIKSFLTALEQLKGNITESQPVVEGWEGQHLDDKYKVVISYLKNYSALSSDLMLVNQSFHDKIPMATTLQSDISEWETLIWDIRVGLIEFLDAEGIQSNFSGLISKLESCAEAERSLDTVCFHLPEDCEDDDDGRKTYLFYRKAVLIRWESVAKTSLELLVNMEREYDLMLFRLYNGTGFDYKVNSSYQDCINIINTTVEFWLPLLDEITNLHLPGYLSAINWTSKLEIAEKFETYFNKMTDRAVTQSQFFPCQFFLKPNWFDKNYSFFLNYINNFDQAYLGQTTQESSLHRQATNLLKTLTDSTDLLVNALNNFVMPGSNSTKIDLYLIFHSKEVLTKEATRSLQLQSYLFDYQKLLIKIVDLQSNLVNAYSYAFRLAILPLSDNLIERLELINAAKKVSTNEDYEDIRYWLSRLTLDRASALVGIIESLYVKYVDVMRLVQSQLINSIQEFDSAVGVLKKELRHYSDLGMLDDNFVRENFIKVDVFYKELKFNHIQQQVSFQLLTLFSEIGGLLGLLLGASVLTVFEFVDFVIMLVTSYCRKD